MNQWSNEQMNRWIHDESMHKIPSSSSKSAPTPSFFLAILKCKSNNLTLATVKLAHFANFIFGRCSGPPVFLRLALQSKFFEMQTELSLQSRIHFANFIFETCCSGFLWVLRFAGSLWLFLLLRLGTARNVFVTVRWHFCHGFCRLSWKVATFLPVGVLSAVFILQASWDVVCVTCVFLCCFAWFFSAGFVSWSLKTFFLRRDALDCCVKPKGARPTFVWEDVAKNPRVLGLSFSF